MIVKHSKSGNNYSVLAQDVLAVKMPKSTAAFFVIAYFEADNMRVGVHVEPSGRFIILSTFKDPTIRYTLYMAHYTLLGESGPRFWLRETAEFNDSSIVNGILVERFVDIA